MALDPRITEQFNLRAPFKLQDATLVVLARVGSHSHNTNLPQEELTSIQDMDYMGVIIPPVDYALGLKNWENTNFQFEELDCVFYSFKKFVSLLLKANPNVIGLLWQRPEDYIVQHGEIWGRLLKNRTLFSTLESYSSFSGYAYGQLKKMTSFDLATQEEFDFAVKVVEIVGGSKNDVINNRPIPMYTLEQAREVDDLTNCHSIYSDIVSRMGWKSFPGSPSLYDVAKSHVSSAIETIKIIHARHYQGYMGDKRKKLVVKHGYDVKNAAHLIRLLRMCVEFLQTGELTVYRVKDADHIRAIKSGKFTLDQIKQEAEELFAQAKREKDASTLPESPDFDTVNELVKHIHLYAYAHDFWSLPISYIGDA
jgi:hypothetical protein